MKSKTKTMAKLKDYLPLYLMMIPGLAYLIINNYIPMFGIVVAFKKFNVMTVSGSTLNKTIAGKKGMTYYVRVVPVSVVNGKTYVGVQNATHSVKIK